MLSFTHAACACHRGPSAPPCTSHTQLVARVIAVHPPQHASASHTQLVARVIAVHPPQHASASHTQLVARVIAVHPPQHAQLHTRSLWHVSSFKVHPPNLALHPARHHVTHHRFHHIVHSRPSVSTAASHHAFPRVRAEHSRWRPLPETACCRSPPPPSRWQGAIDQPNPREHRGRC
jgi:hypothetical protein